MAAPASTAELIDFVRKSGVVPVDKLDRFLTEQAELPPEPTRAVNLLIQKKLLTGFQAKLLLAGRYKGFRLGAYLLQDQLGQGGMGAVYLAVHETLRRKAAIKVLPPGGNKLAVERFLREARAAAALDHPNIVRTHDVGRDGEVHFLVLEYVEGQTLDRLVNAGGPLSTQRAVEFIAQAATGLQHAYEKGFIHRDIKPSNLILSKDGTVKILDMGLARSFEKDDQLTALLDHDAVVGTADYISPEQAMNDPSVDIRTDIYSLGATFFSILTGRPPFDGPTASKLLQHQMKDAPSLTKLDKTIPKDLAQVVARMMAKKANDRFQTPADVIVALHPWLQDTPSLMAGLSQTLAAGSGKLSTQSLRLGYARKPEKKKPNWTWVLAGGIAALVLLGAGVAIAVALSGGGKDTAAGTKPNIPPTPPTNSTARPEGNGKVIFTFDAGTVEPFRAVMDGTTVVEGNVSLFAPGVGPISWREGSRAEFRREEFGGRPALALVNLNENADLDSAQLGFQLETGLGVTLKPGGNYTATVEYATTGAAHGALCLQTLEFKNLRNQKLSNTGGEWKTASFAFRRDPKTPVRFTIDAYASGKESSLQIGRLRVKDDDAVEPGELLSELSWKGMKPITIRKQTLDDKDNPNVKINKLIESTGEGVFPKGWNLWPWNPATVAEAMIDQSRGEWAIGIRNAEGPATTMLFAPQFSSPTGYCRLRCEVLYNGKQFGAHIRIMPEGQKATDVMAIGTSAEWQTMDLPVDCRTLGRVRFEFHNSANADEVLWIRKYEVFGATKDEYPKN